MKNEVSELKDLAIKEKRHIVVVYQEGDTFGTSVHADLNFLMNALIGVAKTIYAQGVGYSEINKALTDHLLEDISDEV